MVIFFLFFVYGLLLSKITKGIKLKISPINLEIGKGGNTISFIAIITYYHSKGYSYKWILNYDNDIDFKKDNDQIFLDLDKSVILELAQDLELTTKKILNTLGK